MLPKVANQLIHHTSRAVAAVQNQTGHTIRNVLQLQSSSGPSSVGTRNGPGSSSSGRGSGAGAGGARQSTSSSRFYSSYSTFGRSVTQADPSTSLTLNSEAFDDVDDVPHTPSTVAAARLHRRTRTSLALHEREARAVKLGVVQALQQHLRAQHAFAAPPRSEIAQSADAREAPLVVTEVQETPDEVSEPDSLLSGLKEALIAKDVQRIKQEVAQIRSSEQVPSTDVYNFALHALHQLRPPGEPLHDILELYNDMVSRSVVPDSRTYGTLIVALTDRDKEVVDALAVLLYRQSWWKQFDAFPTSSCQRLDERISYLRSEANFTSALTLFQASSMIPRLRLPRNVYVSLLASCVEHSNLDAALLIFSHMEKRKDIDIPASAYKHLIAIYSKANDFQGAKEVFEEYKRRATAGNVYPASEEQLHRSGIPVNKWGHVMVFNEMLTAYMVSGQQTEALALLEQMMDSSVDFTLADVPAASSGSFTRIIDGFIRSGDVATAHSWFMRLLDQRDVPQDENVPSPATPQPSTHAWISIIKALASSNMFTELNRLADIAQQRGLFKLRRIELTTIILANIRYAESLMESTSSEDIVPILDQLYARYRPDLFDWAVTSSDIDDLIGIYGMLAKTYVKLGQPDVAIETLEGFVSHMKANDTAIYEDTIPNKGLWLTTFGHAHVRALYGDLSPSWTLKHTLRLAASMGVRSMNPATAIHHLELYVNASEAQKDTLNASDWSVLIHAQSTLRTLDVDGAPRVDMFDLLADMFRRGIDLEEDALRRVTSFLYSTTNPEESWMKMQALGPKGMSIFQRITDSTVTEVRMPSPRPDDIPLSVATLPATTPIRIDPQQSRFVDEFTFGRSGVTVAEAYTRFVDGAKEGRYPSVEVLGRVINALGRQGEREKVVELYKAAQGILSTIQDKEAQLRSWAYIEDSMIIAFAHLENLDIAHLHRTRILQHGGCPSADAYGALIQRIRDTTDDTVSALALFQEAMANGVNPNIFLYNTIISKLAKARKADHALELFHDMRARSIRPTSVTYGAVIAACCRVGDAASAETLFEEMIHQPNFRPRVPPYNTMMQLYTHTKPDRERVLHYYDALLTAGVRPTAHTYKLLIDAFGTIEPVDTAAMEDVFERLLADRTVQVQGTHWAALINAYGCARKDLDKAMAIFESIRSHPSSQRSRSQLPDAVVFEALMNVFVTLRRTDLITEYTSRLPSYGIRMTAYIANLLIKGHASSGNIEQARQIFDSLQDPPEGIAAPFNHAPHEDQIDGMANVQPDGPVYREPSTWEAMVRAELGNGNRDEAVALLHRVQQRRFPPAVYNRISGIMLDDSVSPWASSPSSAVESSSIPSSP